MYTRRGCAASVYTQVASLCGLLPWRRYALSGIMKPQASCISVGVSLAPLPARAVYTHACFCLLCLKSLINHDSVLPCAADICATDSFILLSLLLFFTIHSLSFKYADVPYITFILIHLLFFCCFLTQCSPSKSSRRTWSCRKDIRCCCNAVVLH